MSITLGVGVISLRVRAKELRRTRKRAVERYKERLHEEQKQDKKKK